MSLAKEQLAQGLNPAAEKKKDKIIHQDKLKLTFRSIAEKFIEKKLGTRTLGYVAQFKACLERDIYKYIGDKNIRDVTSADILHINNTTIQSQSLNATGETAAIKNQTYIGAIMRYAIITLRAEYDPTYAVRGSITKPETNHARPLSKKEVAYLR